jgi:hypothetical protein
MKKFLDYPKSVKTIWQETVIWKSVISKQSPNKKFHHVKRFLCHWNLNWDDKIFSPSTDIGRNLINVMYRLMYL